MIFMRVLGLLLVIFGIWSIYIKKNCNGQIEAKFIRTEISMIKGSTNYTPVFSYDYGEKHYEQYALGQYKESDVLNYRPGRTYTIFINQKHPRFCALNNRIQYQTVLMLLMGAIFIVVSYLGG